MGRGDRQRAALDAISILARWLLGALFVYMGLSKALHPEQFLKLVRQYELVANPFLLNAVAAALPWFEVLCGLLLLAGVAVRGSALLVAAMLVPFTLLVFHRALGLAAAQHLPFTAIKFDCGCGGGEVVIWKKIVQNCFMLLVACWLLAGRGRQLCARFGLLADPTQLRSDTEVRG